MNNFIKNLGITAFSALTPLLFFKLLVNGVEEGVMASYFQVKAISTIVFYLLSLRFSEVLYFIKSKYDDSLEQLSGIHFAFASIGLSFSVLISSFSFFVFPFFFPFVASFFLFLSLEIIESKVTLLRLFNGYSGMYLIKVLLLLKPLLFWLLIIYSSILDNPTLTDIFLFELGFIYSLLLIFLGLKFNFITHLKKNIKYLIENKDILKSTWVTSLSKISYDSLPNYMLSFFVSDGIYVQYNIARKIYGIVVTGQTSFIQVFNTLSIDLKKEFKRYLKKFYKIMIPANFIGLIIVFWGGNFFITLLSHEKYATHTTFLILMVMITLSIIYLLLYPIRQWIILNNHIAYLTKSIIISTIIITILVLFLVPFLGVYLVCVLQPFGQILPVVILSITLPVSLKLQFKKIFR